MLANETLKVRTTNTFRDTVSILWIFQGEKEKLKKDNECLEVNCCLNNSFRSSSDTFIS